MLGLSETIGVVSSWFVLWFADQVSGYIPTQCLFINFCLVI